MDARTPRTDPPDDPRLVLIRRRGRVLRSRRRLVAAAVLSSVVIGVVATASALDLPSSTRRARIAAAPATATRTVTPKYASSSTSTTTASPSLTTAPSSRTTPPNETRPPPTPSSTPTVAASPSIVDGRISAGPTCPVEQIDHPCPPAPVVATVQARDPNDETIATTRSQSDGTYRLELPPGNYVLVVLTDTIFPSCPPVDVTVTAGGSTTANITCDTGIR